MTSILWLMRDFRFTDNAALRYGAGHGPILPVFLIDQSVKTMGAAPRWRLEQALKAFDQAWFDRTGQHLTVLAGEAHEVLPDLANKIGARQILQNDWPWMPIFVAQKRLEQAIAGSSITFNRFTGHLLITPTRMMAGRDRAYRVYTPFARRLTALGPDLPVAKVEAVQSLASLGALENHLPLAPDMFGGAEVLAQQALPFGEAEALERLDDFIDNPKGYAANRDFPYYAAGSGLSEPLALGEISPRHIWARCRCVMRERPEYADDLKKFLSELMWREFAWHLLLEFPQMPLRAWRAEWEDFPWRADNPDAEAWRRAATGVPLVDAGLREMRLTGRMENRVRMVVASWLTKHLLTDWRVGLQFFADSLTDWDPASNAMNWQWVAGCGPDASPFFRIFNPLRQAEQYDPEGRYIRHWMQSPQMQKAWLAAIPKEWAQATLPQPILAEDLSKGRERALSALKLYNDMKPAPKVEGSP